MRKQTLTEDCWTIGSYLRSAANKFEEIEKGLRSDDRPNIRGFAAQFAAQKEEANKFAAMFESAASVTIETKEEADE
jgi:hypothetical protein